ncbi:MAG: GGDEF domain-containing protein [Nitrincola sp.]|nr:GGDEF domain-containing protein [Nitrincola sp.]
MLVVTEEKNFLVVLPETHFDMALEIAERLRSKIESEDWSQNVGKSEKITISVGVVSYPEVMGSADQLVFVADQALYQAKNTGRNRVCTPS